MPKWKVQRTVEALLEWEIEADSEEAAQLEADDLTPRMTLMEETSSKARMIPEPEPEQYWTAMGTFHITRYGTEKDARAEIEQALGDVCDEFDIQSID